MHNSSIFLIIAVVALAALALLLFITVAEFKVYKKAGKPGWAIFVPVYNAYVLADIGDRPLWWGIVAGVGGLSTRATNSLPTTAQYIIGAVAFVSYIFYLLICVGVAKNFGRSGAFGVFLLGIIPIIGFPILGYGNAVYKSQSIDLNSNQPLPPTQPLTFPQA